MSARAHTIQYKVWTATRRGVPRDGRETTRAHGALTHRVGTCDYDCAAYSRAGDRNHSLAALAVITIEAGHHLPATRRAARSRRGSHPICFRVPFSRSPARRPTRVRRRRMRVYPGRAARLEERGAGGGSAIQSFIDSVLRPARTADRGPHPHQLRRPGVRTGGCRGENTADAAKRGGAGNGGAAISRAPPSRSAGSAGLRGAAIHDDDNAATPREARAPLGR